MKLKKILSAVAVIGMLACTSAFAATISLTADNTTAAPGETIPVLLKLTENDAGFMGMLFRMEVTGGATIAKPVKVDYTIDDSSEADIYFTPADTDYTTGTLAKINVTIPASASNNDEYVLKVTMDEDQSFDGAENPISGEATITLKAVKASTTSIGTATQGGDLDRQKTFYAPITIDTSAQTGARFWVKKGETEKSWEIPSGIVGVANFYAVVKTAETGTYTYNVVSSTGTAIGTAQTVTID